MSAQIWNDLPYEIKNPITLAAFNNQITKIARNKVSLQYVYKIAIRGG